MKDNDHLNRKVRSLRYDDKRFENFGAAIRHYVHLGIATEKRTETANTLDDKIIKASQKEVVTDSLLPLKTSIDDLIGAMRSFAQKQDEQYAESAKLGQHILRRVDGINEQLSGQLGELLSKILTDGKTTEETLRNVIVLRSILYVYLLAYKTGRIEPNGDAAWTKLVVATTQKAQELSIVELQHLAQGNLETQVVEGLATEMFKIIKSIQPHTPAVPKRPGIKN